MDKIVVGPINKGLRTDRLPFVIDNDSFPILINAYQWRGRIKRKRGTSFLNRLSRYFNSTSTAFSTISSFNLVGGAGNLITSFNLQPNSEIVPATVTITDNTSGNVYTDPTPGNLVGTPTGTGTINYITGAITISGGGADSISASFVYYPDLPVLGLEEFNLNDRLNTGTLAFDTTYAYNIGTASPYNITNVSFYKNPPSSGTYVQKGTFTPLNWNGQNYQQFWSTNYQNAFWVTNGVNVPFTGATIGMQFAPASTITYVSNTSTTITLTITNSPLVVGDFVFLNEWTDNKMGVSAVTLNFQSGYVTAASGGISNTVTITLPNANVALATIYTPGIVQYLTNVSNPAVDCIRWYDGDPTNDNPNPTGFVNGNGWVNFMPPLSRLNFSITDLPPAQYYLVGARLIIEFKDRLHFVGPVVQASVSGALPIYLPDTVVFSQNGTPYYTSSFPNDPSLANTIFNPILVPTNQTATAPAWWEDQTGFGGFVSTGTDETILTAISNEDVYLMGTTGFQVRYVYTGNDLLPFSFYSVDSELTTDSTFSAINMGKGAITRGNRGFIITTQREATRFDLDILDQEFEISIEQNGAERFTAIRDFANEWIYFTYRSDDNENTFPNQTLQYNYRDTSWAIFNESYTHYGQFRRDTGYTWATLPYNTWNSWNEPWNALEGNILKPEVIAGNQQGFVFFRDDGTNEDPSLYIQSIQTSGSPTFILGITSPDHCLNEGDYILINGSFVSPGPNIVQVEALVDENTFVINPPLLLVSPFIGGGTITRMYVPFIQTKQFPTYWDMGKKTRIGVQQYLLSTTPSGQIQLLIFLSQNSDFGYNSGNIVPDANVLNNALIYSTVLYTCLESTNLGLTPANTNLQMISDGSGTTGQQQIWHRINTSLIGDSVQLGFTMSDAQMRDPTLPNQFAEIELHGFTLNVSPSQVLA